MIPHTVVDEPPLRCSFCNKTQADVRKLVAGPSAFICNECVDVCVDIMRGTNDEPPREVLVPAAPGLSDANVVVTCTLCSLPVPRAEALAVAGRGFLCAGCCGEVEASLAEQRETP